jgi:hypothetical protein
MIQEWEIKNSDPNINYNQNLENSILYLMKIYTLET